MSRREDLNEFYEVLDELRARLGGYRRLADCHGLMKWPELGVYFFFESGETREDGLTGRVVRVGTSTRLWERLRQHRGTLAGQYAGGGSHSGTVFRELIAEVLGASGNFEQGSSKWDRRKDAPGDRTREHDLEVAVSAHIRAMPFLWLGVNDPWRKMIEVSAIALLSNFERESIDAPSPDWLGRTSRSAEVLESGLWNRKDVSRSWDHDPTFLPMLRSACDAMFPLRSESVRASP